jgi:hypothetical protein
MQVHSIMRHVAETTGKDVEALYGEIAWPLYRLYGHAFDAFKTMVTDDGDAIFVRLEEDKGAPVEILTPEVSSALHATPWFGRGPPDSRAGALGCLRASVIAKVPSADLGLAAPCVVYHVRCIMCIAGKEGAGCVGARVHSFRSLLRAIAWHLLIATASPGGERGTCPRDILKAVLPHFLSFSTCSVCISCLAPP